MALIPVTKNEFAGKRWRREAGFSFASSLGMAPLAYSEALLACVAMPLAFVARGADLECVALLGLPGAGNAFVGPSGQWLGRYTPAALRGHPFHLSGQQAGGWSVGFDDASGLLTSAEGEGAELILDAQGNPSAAFQGVAEFLISRQRGYEQTRIATRALQDVGAITPWPIKLSADPGAQAVQGLFQIDPAVLNALGDEQFLTLRRAGSLVLANAQMASMSLLRVLGELTALRPRLAQTAPAPAAPASAVRAPRGLDGLNVSIEDGQFKFD